jgi:hypothetical protein
MFQMKHMTDLPLMTTAEGPVIGITNIPSAGGAVFICEFASNYRSAFLPDLDIDSRNQQE